MKILRSLLVGWMAATTIRFPGLARRPACVVRSGAHATNFETQPQTTDLAEQRAVVVKLRVQRPGKPDETAAGLFVGKDANNAYFITALHALKVNPKSEDLTFVPSVQLQFNSSPTEFQASVFSHYDDGLDLGIVQTAASNVPPEVPQIARSDVAANTPIHIIGHPPAGGWSVWTGSVQNENTPDGGIQQFITSTSRDNSLVEGYSGGSVFDSSGAFVGMHSKTTTNYGISTKSADIVAQLKAWHVPVNNFTEAKPPKPEPGPSAEAEINKVVDAFEAAYHRKDAEALRKIWPNAPKNIVDSFGFAQSITMRITDRSLVVETNGASATLTGQYSQVYVPKNGPEMKSSGAITFKLDKKKETWLITSVT